MFIDLGAPILPGVGAAGLLLGEALDPALRADAFAVERVAHDCVRYSFDSVRVSVRYGLTTQIALSAGYAGTIGGVIGIGSTIAEVEAHCGGKVTADPEAHHLVPPAPGWCFDALSAATDDPTDPGGAARVSEVFVFVPPNEPLRRGALPTISD